MRYTLALLATLIGTPACSSTLGQPNEPQPVEMLEPVSSIEWKEFDETRTYELAQKVKKPVAIYFKLIDCQHCDAFENNALADHRVVKVMNNEFVSTVVTSNNEHWDELTEKYRASGFPMIALVHRSGTDGLLRIVGNQVVEQVLAQLLIGHQLDRIIDAKKTIRILLELPLFERTETESLP